LNEPGRSKLGVAAQVMLVAVLLPVTVTADVLTAPERRAQAAAATCNAGYAASCIDYQAMQQQEIQREADQRAWWRNQSLQNSIDMQTNQQALDAQLYHR